MVTFKTKESNLSGSFAKTENSILLPSFWLTPVALFKFMTPYKEIHENNLHLKLSNKY